MFLILLLAIAHADIPKDFLSVSPDEVKDVYVDMKRVF